MTWTKGLLLTFTLSTVATVALAQASDQGSAAPGSPANPPAQYPYQQPAPSQQPAPIVRSNSVPQNQQQYPQQYPQQQQSQPQYQQQYPQQQQSQPQYQQQYPQQQQSQPQYQQQYPQQQQSQPQYQQQYPQQQYQQQYPQQQNQQQYQQPAPGGAQSANNPDYSNDFIDKVTPGQVIAPMHGTASAVPATGVFLRVAQGGSVRVVELSDVELELDVTHGVANIAIHNSVKGAEFLIDLPGGQTDLIKDGFYTFNANTDTMRVLKGEAYAYPGDHMNRKPIKIKEKHAIYFNGPSSHVFEFDPNEVTGDLVPFGPPPQAGQGQYGSGGYMPYGSGEPYDWYQNGYPYWWSYPYWWDPGWDWGWGLGWGWGWGGWGRDGWGRGDWGRGGWGGDRGGWGGGRGGWGGGGGVGRGGGGGFGGGGGGHAGR